MSESHRKITFLERIGISGTGRKVFKNNLLNSITFSAKLIIHLRKITEFYYLFEAKSQTGGLTNVI